MVKIRQRDQRFGRNIPFAIFVIGIANLGTVQQLGKIFLFQVMIFPKIPDSLIHFQRPYPNNIALSIDKTKCNIVL